MRDGKLGVYPTESPEYLFLRDVLRKALDKYEDVSGHKDMKDAAERFNVVCHLFE